jgi:hypothetical protein
MSLPFFALSNLQIAYNTSLPLLTSSRSAAPRNLLTIATLVVWNLLKPPYSSLMVIFTPGVLSSPWV